MNPAFIFVLVMIAIIALIFIGYWLEDIDKAARKRQEEIDALGDADREMYELFKKEGKK